MLSSLCSNALDRRKLGSGKGRSPGAKRVRVKTKSTRSKLLDELTSVARGDISDAKDESRGLLPQFVVMLVKMSKFLLFSDSHRYFFNVMFAVYYW